MRGAAAAGASLEEVLIVALQHEQNAQQQLVGEAAGIVTPMTLAEVARCARES